MNEVDRFIVIVDVAIEACNKVIHEGEQNDKKWYISNGIRSLAWLEVLRTNALKSGLPEKSEGTLGLSRDFSEWAPDYLYEAAVDIEEFYANRI